MVNSRTEAIRYDVLLYEKTKGSLSQLLSRQADSFDQAYALALSWAELLSATHQDQDALRVFVSFHEAQGSRVDLRVWAAGSVRPERIKL